MKGVKSMTNHIIQIEVPEGRVKEILDTLAQAQNTIRDCYYELERLGVLTVREKTVSGN